MKKNEKETVLLIEDEVDLLEILKDYLESNDYNVLTAKSRSEAFFKINNQKFDCIVSDINLKQNDAVPIFNELRSNPKGMNFGVPVIVHSAHVTGPMLRKNKGIIKAVFIKPAASDNLIDKIKEVILQSKASLDEIKTKSFA